MNNTSVLNNTVGNGSFPRFSFPPQFSDMEWIFGMLMTHCVFCLFIIVSNILVLHAFYKNQRLRTTTNLVIISMACADLAVGIVVIPLWLYGVHLTSIRGPPYTKTEKNFIESYQYIDQALALTSIYHLVCLHSLRSYSITYPLRHRKMSNRPVIIAVLLIWAICIAFPPVTNRLIIPRSCRNCFVYVSLISNLGVPLVIMSVANVILWRSVAKSSRQHQKDTKILVTVAILLGLLCVCFLPFLIVTVIVRVHKLFIHLKVIVALKFLHFSNSGLNPMVYALRNPELGRTVRRQLCGEPSRDITTTARTMGTSNPATIT